MTLAGDGFDVRSLAVTFRSGALLSSHSHPWGQLVSAQSGVMRVTTDQRWWLVPATKAIWLPPGLAHEVAAQGEVAMRTLYISPDRAALLPDEPAALQVVPLLRELILHILTLGMLSPDCGRHRRLSGLLIDLIAEARRQDLGLPLPRDRRALMVAKRLQAQPAAAIDLAEVANDAGATLRTLQRIFPRETGLTLRSWRQKLRLIHAMASLASGSSVSQAAFDCGYGNAGAFTVAFSRQFGTTPGRHSTY